jgi:pimeloyl-ACP methyl ester carboxylesterase
MLRRGLHALFLVGITAATVRAQGTDRLPVSDIDYRLVEGPQGSDTIVMIHGLGSTQHTFNRVVAELSRKYTVLIYDQRGHGRSAVRGDDYSTEVLARDLKGLHDHLGLGKVHLLGHSLGARTAVRYAAMFPGDVKSVIVEDMELRPWSYSEKEQRRIARRGNRLRDHPQIFSSKEEAARSLAPMMAGKKPEQKLEQARAFVERKVDELPDGRVRLLYSPYANHQYLYQARGEDLGPALAAIPVPVLFIAADQKIPIMTEPGVAHLRQYRPDAPIVQIAGSGHAIHRTHQQEFIDVVDHFVSETARAPSRSHPLGLVRGRPRAARPRLLRRQPRGRR